MVSKSYGLLESYCLLVRLALFALRLLALQLLLHPALEEEARVGVALIAAVSTQLSTCFAVKEMSGHNIAITD